MDIEADLCISPLTTWNLQPLPHDPAYLASQDELRNLLFTTAQTPAPTRRGSPSGDGLRQAGEIHTNTLASSDFVGRVLSSGRRLEYLDNYVGRVASWTNAKKMEKLDMFDSRRIFAITIPHLSRHSPALLNAILAISARQLELMEGIRNPCDSLELYQEAIHMLKPLLQARDEDAITVSVILCCMEMMSASGEEWRRHLDGCAALFVSFGVNGFSDDLRKALFWCYARMDLCGALMSDGTQSTLIEPWRWLAPGVPGAQAQKLFAQSRSPDMHANYSVYLCAKVCELLADRTKYTELGEDNGCSDVVYATRWNELWGDLQAWLDQRPEEILPLQTLDGKPFPHILFVHWAAISANQLHHTACLLLLEMAPPEAKQILQRENMALGYAKRICGISLTNPHQGCINNAVQPLWIAGRHLTHKSEHAILIRLFKNIEQTTGWVTSWRVVDLERIWGYKIRKS